MRELCAGWMCLCVRVCALKHHFVWNNWFVISADIYCCLCKWATQYASTSTLTHTHWDFWLLWHVSQSLTLLSAQFSSANHLAKRRKIRNPTIKSFGKIPSSAQRKPHTDVSCCQFSTKHVTHSSACATLSATASPTTSNWCCANQVGRQ